VFLDPLYLVFASLVESSAGTVLNEELAFLPVALSQVNCSTSYRTAWRRARMQALMPRSTVKSERRKKSRKRPLTLIYVEFPSGNGGMIRDLNEEGFAVRAMMPLRAGEITPFSFSLNESVRIEGECEILWVEEDGRVAGVRFTHMPSTTLAQIQGWLSAPEAPLKRNEVAGKSVAPAVPTLDQLRGEIRSVPVGIEPPGAVHAAPPPSAPETVPAEPEIIPRAHPLGNLPSGLQASAPVDTPFAAVPGPLSSPISIPVLPPRPESPKEIESTVESVPAARSSVYDAFVSVGNANPFLSPVIPESDGASPQASPDRPDISEILMQPSGKPASHPPNATPYGRLAKVGSAPESMQARWTERFTPSRVVRIMILLTLAVAASAFHQQLGNTLIWLGVQMGGTQVSQFREPVPGNTVPIPAPDVPSSNPSDSLPPNRASAEPARGDRQNAAGSSELGNQPQSSLSLAAKSSLPPVTPLSGMSASSSNIGQETGQAEYMQAMQLLRGKNAGAGSSETVRLLWISVEKGNPNAELVLADMYWHGQGVARNCDQTRILLSAAARKGSAEAQKRLQQFQREGCE
jgi:hypothetical protein